MGDSLLLQLENDCSNGFDWEQYAMIREQSMLLFIFIMV